jgi:hypothetical protein
MPEPVNEGSNKLINVLEDDFSGLKEELTQVNIGLESLKQELGDIRNSFGRSNSRGNWGNGDRWEDDKSRNDAGQAAKTLERGKHADQADAWEWSTVETTCPDASLYYIQKLPSELLRRIIAMARDALQSDTHEWGRSYGDEEMLRFSGAQSK